MNLIDNIYQADAAIWGISYPLWEEMSLGMGGRLKWMWRGEKRRPSLAVGRKVNPETCRTAHHVGNAQQLPSCLGATGPSMQCSDFTGATERCL